MTVELVIFLNDDVTEEEIKDVARVLLTLPITQGVYRWREGKPHEYQVTHDAPGAIQ